MTITCQDVWRTRTGEEIEVEGVNGGVGLHFNPWPDFEPSGFGIALEPQDVLRLCDALLRAVPSETSLAARRVLEPLVDRGEL